MRDKNLDKKIQNYIVSPEQMAIDYKMVPYDIWGTIAHVVMLYEAKILNKDKTSKILKALFEIQKDYNREKFKIDPKKGAQLTLESKIIEIAGEEAGLSAHTARSRNDQVMTAEMLYLKDKILETIGMLLTLIYSLVSLAQDHKDTIMAGYTHMQPAKPTTFGLWCLSYCDSFIRGIEALKNVYQRYDLNPLGSVESYGTSWPIDRELTTKLLGFKHVWEIPQDAISSRGFFQLNILSAINEITLTAGKLGSDLLLFSTFEFGMIKLSQDVAKRAHQITGSSVMPQKKNPDVLELVRSTAPQITGFYQIVSGILAGLPSGYNRDTREVKEYIDLGFKKTKSCIQILEKVLGKLIVNKKRMFELVCHNYSLTTDMADYLSQSQDAPYRQVYKIMSQMVYDLIEEGKLLTSMTSEDINSCAKQFGVASNISNKDLKQVLDPKKAIERRKHIGGTDPKIAKSLVKKRICKINSIEDWVATKQNIMIKAKQKTWESALKIIKKS